MCCPQDEQLNFVSLIKRTATRVGLISRTPVDRQFECIAAGREKDVYENRRISSNPCPFGSLCIMEATIGRLPKFANNHSLVIRQLGRRRRRERLFCSSVTACRQTL